jgi:hypothetical protein
VRRVSHADNFLVLNANRKSPSSIFAYQYLQEYSSCLTDVLFLNIERLKDVSVL